MRLFLMEAATIFVVGPAPNNLLSALYYTIAVGLAFDVDQAMGRRADLTVHRRVFRVGLFSFALFVVVLVVLGTELPFWLVLAAIGVGLYGVELVLERGVQGKRTPN